jgi:hypothetical protein
MQPFRGSTKCQARKYQMNMNEVNRWQDCPIGVRARLVPRFLWSTASIDVFLGEKCILRTGGQFKFKGSHSTTFILSGSSHTAELSWGYGSFGSFPYQLRIDDAPVCTSRVYIGNQMMGIVGAILFAALLVLVLHFV